MKLDDFWILEQSCQILSVPIDNKHENPQSFVLDIAESLISHGKSRTFCRSLVALVQEAWHNCQRHTENPEIHSTTARASIEIDGNTKKNQKTTNIQRPNIPTSNIQQPNREMLGN